MNTIWKYPIQIVDEQVIPMPKGAEILYVQMQGDAPFLWVKVDSDAQIESRRIVIHGTGHELAEDARTYIGTFMINNGALVFHVFSALPMPPNGMGSGR